MDAGHSQFIPDTVLGTAYRFGKINRYNRIPLWSSRPHGGL